MAVSKASSLVVLLGLVSVYTSQAASVFRANGTQFVDDVGRVSVHNLLLQVAMLFPATTLYGYHHATLLRSSALCLLLCEGLNAVR